MSTTEFQAVDLDAVLDAFESSQDLVDENESKLVTSKQDETKSTYAEFWNNPKEWPVTIDIEQFQISKLTQRKIFKEESQETIDMFVKLEWKQLDQYNKIGMFGEPIARELVRMFKILT